MSLQKFAGLRRYLRISLEPKKGTAAFPVGGFDCLKNSFQNAPEQFPSEEFPISESKVNMDVNFPGAAFVVVSCKESQSGFRKE